MLIGYIRPFQEDLNCEIQHQNITKTNCDTIIIEDHSSAKKRIKLKNMIDNLNQGDKIVVTKLFTFADSTRHLVELLDAIDAKGGYFQSLKEGVDTSNDSGYFFKNTVKHLVEFQSDVISEKTKKGLYEAKQKGVITGRPRKSDENVDRAITMYQSKKYTLAEIKNETGISKSTLYRYLEN
ncbi:recombinase family protein [Bacillus sp. V3B]|uniref:recombinase family protein n=1 Tax=Bacillus sp. V3B TaxID=2804915 RepID=UPI00210D1E9A|nr:recombinase family protein [Bacillus sp. V3B]MCQ6273949.1 recombinase family protein [Bacillus sp. V3B]